MKKFVSIFKNKEIVNRIFFSIMILFVVRIGAAITVPGVHIEKQLDDLMKSGNSLAIMDLLGGGALSNFSVFALGVSPYITAQIIIQLLSKDVLPALTELSKQGEYGRKKSEMATRYLTLLLGAVQSYGIIRTMENKNHMAFWTALGANPTPLAWPEVYISLQNGTIAAQENAADTCASANFQEVQKYLNFTNHILYLNQVVMNNEKFDSLDPAYQQALLEAVQKSIDEVRPELEKLDKDSKDKLAAGGMEMVEYDDSFYDEVLNLDGVKELYADIDTAVDGLGTILQNELAK